MKKQKLILAITFIYFFVFFLLFSSFSLYRMYSLQIFHYDFGIFARVIWQLSRFQVPFIDHRVLGNIFFLGDHFNPSLIILAPLFWLTSNVSILFFEQALTTTLSGLIIFLISRKLKFSHISSIIFSTVFLLFAGTENPLVTDWHPEPTAGFFLILFFYLFSFTKYKKLSYLSAFIFLGFKESNALTLIFLLIWMLFLTNKRTQTNPIKWLKLLIQRSRWQSWKGSRQRAAKRTLAGGKTLTESGEQNFKQNNIKEIIHLILFSLTWFILTTKFFIPFVSHQPYMYSPDIPLSPIKIVQNYVNNPLKTKLIFDSFISFGFLPIFSLIGLIPVFLELGVRLIPNSSIFQNYALTFHYNVYLGIFLSLATIYGVKNVKKIIQKLIDINRNKWKLIVIKNNNFNEFQRISINLLFIYLLLISLYTARKITTSPINFAISPVFWRELKPRQDFLDALKLIPKTGSVMSQNNILPYLVTRKERVYFLKEDYETYKPDIIVIDLTSGQNPNNFWDANYEIALKIKEKLLKDKLYKGIETKNINLFIFIKTLSK